MNFIFFASLKTSKNMNFIFCKLKNSKKHEFLGGGDVSELVYGGDVLPMTVKIEILKQAAAGYHSACLIFVTLIIER